MNSSDVSSGSSGCDSTSCSDSVMVCMGMGTSKSYSGSAVRLVWWVESHVERVRERGGRVRDGRKLKMEGNGR